MVTAKKHSRWTMPLVAAVFLFTTVFQLLSPVLAYADTAGDMHDINYKHYAAIYLRDCLFNLPNEKKNQVLQARVNNPAYLFASGYKVPIGLYMEENDGLAGCEEAPLIQTALFSLGYADDPGRLLTDIGYTVDKTELGCSVENAACENGKQNRYTRPASGDTFNIKFARSLGAVPGYARYAAYQKIFASKCSLVEPPTGKGSAITYKTVVLNGGEYKVEDAKAEFTIDDRGSAPGGQKITFDTGRTPIQRYEYEGKNTTCRDLRVEMDGLMQAVREYNNEHKDDPLVVGSQNGTEEGCTEKSPGWNKDTKTCSKDKPACTDQIKGIGWLICPTMEFLASINDHAYGFLAGNFLQTDKGLVDGARDAWSRFKDLANVAFVIALLFVIYSQVTSVGISNYGIKKMLPKIIVAALLVNMSFIICQVAVDLSNIVGYSITKFFSDISNISNVPASTSGGSDGVLNGVGIALSWTVVVTGILAAGVGLAMALSFPVVLSALLAIGMIALILIARKALIVLLIVVAPLAFVAYLLPNTEQWFKKWVKLFSTLLLLFPIVGVVFGASMLAGKIVATATDDPLMQLTALAITALPFFIVPGLLKGSLNAIGSVGTRMQGWANKAGGGVGSAVKNRSQLGATYQAAREHRKQAQAIKMAKGRGSGLSRVVGRVAGGREFNEKSRLRARDLENQEFEKDVNSISGGYTTDMHEGILESAETGKDGNGRKLSDAERVAAIRYTAKAGSGSNVAHIDTTGDTSSAVKNAAMDAYRDKGLTGIVGNKVLSKIGSEGMNWEKFHNITRERFEKGEVSPEAAVRSDSMPKLINDALVEEAKEGRTLSSTGLTNYDKMVNGVQTNEATRKATTIAMGNEFRSIRARLAAKK